MSQHKPRCLIAPPSMGIIAKSSSSIGKGGSNPDGILLKRVIHLSYNRNFAQVGLIWASIFFELVSRSCLTYGPLIRLQFQCSLWQNTVCWCESQSQFLATKHNHLTCFQHIVPILSASMPALAISHDSRMV
jgi:hypothetical protein